MVTTRTHTEIILQGRWRVWQVDFVVDLLVKHVTRLREMSPLWEMVQEGIDISVRTQINTWMQ